MLPLVLETPCKQCIQGSVLSINSGTPCICSLYAVCAILKGRPTDRDWKRVTTFVGLIESHSDVTSRFFLLLPLRKSIFTFISCREWMSAFYFLRGQKLDQELLFILFSAISRDKVKLSSHVSPKKKSARCLFFEGRRQLYLLKYRVNRKFQPHTVYIQWSTLIPANG